MTAAEPVQELGRRGVATIKRWLEATTYIELPFDIYNHEMECTISHLGGVKRLDLRGHFLTGNKDPIMVECKRYSTTGGQYSEYQRLLAIAYSAAIKELEEFGKCHQRHFLWVTYHPFNLENWSSLETHQQIRLGLEKNPALLGDKAIDEDLIREIASRVMVLVFNEKQKSLSLTKKELNLFRGIVNRKANSL